MQVKQIQLAAIQTIGFRGEGIQDEHKLFRQLKSRKNEIEHRIDEHAYLVISPDGLYVAAAVARFGAIPEGMESVTIPAGRIKCFGLKRSISATSGMISATLRRKPNIT
ncbi:GyrI-like domain-containing protein [Cohnella sp. REN36]|uniref:GyrI-like domain-containing protein n=1 Tax=Cohnella sp. REN36 TaxID=2887347 RepID=UPI001D138265|nr:GyrI-like domain-containing protein [Cohnella sp. REN36]MCC3372919.1 GyrI-like domain-containing protein [Cohnella sp. REN36]